MEANKGPCKEAILSLEKIKVAFLQTSITKMLEPINISVKQYTKGSSSSYQHVNNKNITSMLSRHQKYKKRVEDLYLNT